MLQTLKGVEKKIRQLAQQLDSLRKENAELAEQNRQLKNNLADKSYELKLCTEKLVKAQQALEQKNKQEPESSTKLRAEINHYINEIDTCIEWLKNS